MRQEEGGEGGTRSSRTGPRGTRCALGVPRKRQATLCAGAAHSTAGAPGFHNPPFEPAGHSARATQHLSHMKGEVRVPVTDSPAALTPRGTAHFQSPHLENESPSHGA